MIQCHVYEPAKVMNIFNTCGVSCHCQYSSHLHNEKCICELFSVPVKKRMSSDMAMSCTCCFVSVKHGA